LSDKRRKELADFYREDVEKLEQMIGRDLSHWCSA
jgi:tetrahydromethanopterin S-methyltransferase subunit F